MSALLAVSASIFMFLYATYLGIGALGLSGRRSHVPIPPKFVLICPALGFAIVTLPVLWLNWLGLPVGRFALPLAIVLFAVASAGFVRAFPSIRWRILWPIGASIALAFVLTGRPLFEYGFDWLSFSNDDMANYALGAQRLIDYGFFSVPDMHQFTSGTNATLYYWVLYAALSIRTGIEETLAFFAVLLRLTPFAAFMPVILAMHLMLIASSAALVFQTSARRVAASITALALAISAPMTLGTVYQLIAQVCGLGLLNAVLAIGPAVLRRPSVRGIFVASVIVAGLFAIYPEATPFLFLGLGLVVVLRAARARRIARGTLVSMGAVAFAVAVLLNTNLLTYARTLVLQSDNGTRFERIHLFWYMLLPGAPATMFGILPIATRPDDPIASLASAIGFVLLAGFVVLIAIALVRRVEPLATVPAVMLALAALLFTRHSDFGLLKLSMYIQTYLWGLLALLVTGALWRRAIP